MNEKIKNKFSTISTSAGVYIMKDITGKVIYVGKAKNLKNRVSSYFNNTKKHIKVQAMVNSIEDFDYIVCKTEYDALALENNLIKKYQPHYNILLKDSKTFPYLKVDIKQDYPSFTLTRRVEKDGAKYFGPFIGRFKAKDILQIINSAFNLRDCKQNISIEKKCKPCLRKHLGLCLAPCINAGVQKQYKTQVKKAIDYLSGNDSDIVNILQQKMQNMINDQNYEKAIVYRDDIKIIKSLNGSVITELSTKQDLDIIAYSSNGQNTAIAIGVVRSGKVLGIDNQIIENVSQSTFQDYVVQYYQNNKLPNIVLLCEHISNDAIKYILDTSEQNAQFVVPQKGIKKQLLQMVQNNAEQAFIKQVNKQELEKKRTIEAVYNLQNLLHLSKPPLRIECYDISHISGDFKVASMVVFINGKANKAHYRKFKIKEVQGNDDFASLKETLKRRFLELQDSNNKDISFSQVPDLLVIDGGKGQLSSVTQILEEVAPEFKDRISLISLAKKEEEIFVPNKQEPILIAKNKMELQLIQRLRDEAHRFAIMFHRSLRGKGMLVSMFDEIDGIGPKKKKALLKEFDTYEKLQNASIEDFARVPGINEKIATNLYNRLHQ